MTIAYSTSPKDRQRVLAHWDGTPAKEVLTSRMFWQWQLWFGALLALSYFFIPAEEASDLIQPVGYATGLLGSLFIFQITAYNNTAFERYCMHWNSAIKGWIRLNDICQQLYAHLNYNPHLGCEIMRLVHAANHLHYLDMGGQMDLKNTKEHDEMLVRRGLLTHDEFIFLQKYGSLSSIDTSGAAGFNPALQCSTWALQLVSNEVHSGRLAPPLGKALDQSILTWRENTQYILSLELNPIPFAYYYLLCLELDVFQLCLAAFMSLYFVADYDGVYGPYETRFDRGDEVPIMMLTACVIGQLLFTLLFQCLFWTGVMLANPWSSSASSLPAEEYLLLPLASHKALFRCSFFTDQPPDHVQKESNKVSPLTSKGPSPFLAPLRGADKEAVRSLATSATAALKRLTAEHFRNLMGEIHHDYDQHHSHQNLDFSKVEKPQALEAVAKTLNATKDAALRVSRASVHAINEASAEMVSIKKRLSMEIEADAHAKDVPPQPSGNPGSVKV